MSDLVPYYSPLPITRAARDQRQLAQQHQRAREDAKLEAELFEFRTRETLHVARAHVTGMSLLDYTITASCGDRAAFEMEMRSIVPMLNVGFVMAAARFQQGR